jgi:hypothetical protein
MSACEGKLSLSRNAAVDTTFSKACANGIGIGSAGIVFLMMAMGCAMMAMGCACIDPTNPFWQSVSAGQALNIRRHESRFPRGRPRPKCLGFVLSRFTRGFVSIEPSGRPLFLMIRFASVGNTVNDTGEVPNELETPASTDEPDAASSDVRVPCFLLNELVTAAAGTKAGKVSAADRNDSGIVLLRQATFEDTICSSVASIRGEMLSSDAHNDVCGPRVRLFMACSWPGRCLCLAFFCSRQPFKTKTKPVKILKSVVKIS